ncbi:MAG TPA: hypothetical protein VHA11_11560 [Bryobacteraceae bacterium]|nr:hypothetical protein [Bryobacteraceae bacterium]
MTGSVAVTIPGGFEHAGSWRRQLYLRPWRGRDEMALFELSGSVSPAARATELLARCVSVDDRQPAGREFVRRLTVGDREALLLQLHNLTMGDRLSCLLVCPSCGQAMDLDLRATGLLSPPTGYEGPEYQASVSAQGRSYRLVFRLPNGGDQETAAAMMARGEEEAMRALVRRCVASITRDDGAPQPEIPSELTGELSQKMAALDPQAELLLDCICAHCGETVRSLFDAAHYVLREVDRSAETLLRDIHAIARVFHWREAEILAMSTRRRKNYVALIGGAAAGGGRG